VCGKEEKEDVLGKSGSTGVADALTSHARSGQDELRLVVGIGEVARVDGRWSSVAPGGVGGGGGGGGALFMAAHQEESDGKRMQGHMLECAWKMLHPQRLLPRGHHDRLGSQLSHSTSPCIL
jgi:hypothetical protein